MVSFEPAEPVFDPLGGALSDPFVGQFLAQIPAAVIAIDAEERVTFWSAGAERLYGWPAADVLGKPLRSVNHYRWLRSDEEPAAFETLARTGAWSGENIHLRRDGSERQVESSVTVLRGLDGAEAGFLAVIHDITERRQAEAAARLSEQRLQIALQHSSITVYSQDRDLRYTWVHNDVPGVWPNWVLGKTDAELIAPEEAAELTALKQAVLASGTGVRREVSTTSALGVRCFDLAIKPLLDEAGAIAGVTGTAVDITERKREEAALRLLSETGALFAGSLDYETTLQQVAAIVVPSLADACTVDLLNGSGQLKRVAVATADPAFAAAVWAAGRAPLNPDAPAGPAAVLRSGKPELVADVPESLLAATARNREHLELLRRVQVTSHIMAPLIVHGRTLGLLQFISTQARHRYGARDLSLAEELAHRAAVAIENARLYRDTQEAMRVREQFVSAVSHDLRSPLTAISGLTHLLQRRAGRGPSLSSAQAAPILSSIARSTQTMERMLEELLDLARLEADQPLDLARQPTDLVALARRVAAEQQATSDHRILVDVSVAALVGDWDPVRLERVLTNLLSNAVKYSPGTGTITLTVGVCAGAAAETGAGEWAELIVRDHGLGIPAADLPRIFERFHRGANVVGRIAGVGLGLAGAKQIVEQHGGVIIVESEEGSGSTFVVRLPRGETEAAEG